eukprot:2471042-Prymnesium_polylepis.1
MRALGAAVCAHLLECRECAPRGDEHRLFGVGGARLLLESLQRWGGELARVRTQLGGWKEELTAVGRRARAGEGTARWLGDGRCGSGRGETRATRLSPSHTALPGRAPSPAA